MPRGNEYRTLRGNEYMTLVCYTRFARYENRAYIACIWTRHKEELGGPRKARSKPRDIIVKLATYRNRLTFYKQRTLLKERGHTGVFVNEDLTKFRSGLLYDARRLAKVSLV